MALEVPGDKENPLLPADRMVGSNDGGECVDFDTAAYSTNVLTYGVGFDTAAYSTNALTYGVGFDTAAYSTNGGASRCA
ncbi:MAG TPA: hypothetical protein PKL67_07960, partial [Anaerolineae bacterium]|nr:hypothetical protein [Anaerolineae bacterium]